MTIIGARTISAKRGGMSATGLLVGVALAGLGWSGTAAAQTADAPQAQEQEQEQEQEQGGDAEIYVTARKRYERAQDIPDAISTFSAATIERANIRNIADVAVRVPNFALKESVQPGAVQITVRGIGQTRIGEPPVAVVVDGVQLTSTYQITQDLFDIEQIEVLKGPQGAVYGRNAMGGAINIATRQPTNELSGFASAGYGTADDVRFSAGLSGAIVPDKILFRIAGSYRDFDGDVPVVNAPIGKGANYQQDRSIRGTIVVKPVENFKVDLRYSHLETRSGGAWYTPVPPGTSPNEPLPYIGDFPNRAERLLDDASGTLSLDLPGVTLTSITAYSHVKTSLDEDLDYTPLDQLSANVTFDIENISQEVRATSSGSGPLKWMAGVYYLYTNQLRGARIFAGRARLAALGLPVSLAPLLASRNGADDRNNAYAAFGQVSYRVGSIELTGALRYDIDDRHQTDLVAAGNPQFDATFKSLQPKVSAAWFFDQDAMVYATISKGFRSGGFNPQARITRIYKKEENWNYELGFKLSALDRAVNLSGAAFYQRIRNRQIYILDSLTAAQTIANPVPRAESYGVEAQADLQPVRNLDLSASIGWNKTRVLSYDTLLLAGLPSAGDFTGNDLPQVPGVSYTFAGQYAIDLGEQDSLTPRLEFNGSGGSYYWELDNVNKRRALNLMNLRLTYAHGPVSITGFVDNVLKERYLLDFSPRRWNGGASDFSEAAGGRRWGARAIVRF